MFPRCRQRCTIPAFQGLRKARQGKSMTGSEHREVNGGESRPGPGGAQRGSGRPGPEGGRLQITRISDEDYRCVWRPCPALEESEGGGTTG